MSANKDLFVPENISINEIEFVKRQVDDPENFDISHIEGFLLENSLEYGFNLEEKLLRADHHVKIKTESNGNNEQEVVGTFHFVYIYEIKNLDGLVQMNEKNLIELDDSLATAMSLITYSTSRGILFTAVQGTSLQNFVLPVVQPHDFVKVAFS